MKTSTFVFFNILRSDNQGSRSLPFALITPVFISYTILSPTYNAVFQFIPPPTHPKAPISQFSAKAVLDFADMFMFGHRRADNFHSPGCRVVLSSAAHLAAEKASAKQAKDASKNEKDG